MLKVINISVKDCNYNICKLFSILFKFFNIPFIFEDWQRSSEFLLITFGREKKDIKHTTIEYIDNNCGLKAVFSPYSNKLLYFLCSHGLIPSLISKKKRKLILAYIQCESHFPKVIKYLKK